MLRFDRPKPKMRSFRLHRGGPFSGALATLGSFLLLVYVVPIVIVAVAELIGRLQG
ncbi:MAG: hypothetical protein WBC44_08960 [Planctomycetaceae bacterium]